MSILTITQLTLILTDTNKNGRLEWKDFELARDVSLKIL